MQAELRHGRLLQLKQQDLLVAWMTLTKTKTLCYIEYKSQAELLRGRLLQLKELVDDTEDLVNIELDHRQEGCCVKCVPLCFVLCM